MEDQTPTITFSSDKEELAVCRELVNEILPLLDKLTTAVKYYRSPWITKDQYRELQDINKYLDSHELIDDSSCCLGEEEHMH